MPSFLPLTRRDLLTGSALLAGAGLLPRAARAAVGEGSAVRLSAGPA
ncbi:twin-arginine translocation signal domain-containing protein, partial [Azospirillum formosense]|nr:twin-arginine translocation signal domain-containing protein [Azospirillum formosense]